MDLGFDVAQQLMPNILTMLTQWCATGVLFFFVYKFLFNPAREMIAKRQDYMQGKMDEAKRYEEEAKKHEEASFNEIQQAKKMSQDIIARAKEEAVSEQDRIIKEANRKAEEKLQKAEDAILKQKAEVQKDLHAHIVNVALAASEKLMNQEALDAENVRSLERFVEEIENESSK